MTDDNRLDALCQERKRPVRPRVVDVPIDRHDRFNKAPFSFVRPFATLPEIDLVVRDMRERRRSLDGDSPTPHRNG